MGGKQFRTRKQVHFCIAVLISLATACCSTVLPPAPIKPSQEGRTKGEEALMHLALGRRLFAERDFVRALQEHEKVSSLVQNGPINEEALLYTGLIYVDPANPRRDYARSIGYFKKLSEGYPKSPYAEQAKIMIAIIRENEESIRTIERLKALIEAAKKVDIGIEDRKREKVR